MAFCRITGGHDREGLDWADRATAAPGTLPPYREQLLPALGRSAISVPVISIRPNGWLAKLNDRFPFETWRGRRPMILGSETDRERFRSIQDALKAAGNRDHLDPDADFGVAPDDVLHEPWVARRRLPHPA